MVTSAHRNAGKPHRAAAEEGSRGGEGEALGRKGKKRELLPNIGRKKEEDIKNKQNDMGQNQQPEENC